MKSQMLTILLALLTVSNHAFATCELTLMQRGNITQAQPQLDRFERTLSRANISTPILFKYRDFESEISTVRVSAENDRACFEQAVAKAAEMENATVHIEVTELEQLGVEERFIDAPSHPVVRWRFNDGWSIFFERGIVSDNAITCNRTTETSYRGERVYSADCKDM